MIIKCFCEFELWIYFLVSGLFQKISRIHSVQKHGKKRKTAKSTDLKFIEIKRCPHTGIKFSVKILLYNHKIHIVKSEVCGLQKQYILSGVF